MGLSRFDTVKHLIVRVEHDSDLITFITSLAKSNGLKAGTFTAIGALKHAKIGFYDQEKHEYLEVRLSDPQEIASCIGNISIKKGVPFVHAHAVLADQKGDVKAGHLLEGKVFAAEVHIIEFPKNKLVRKNDETTGLFLLDL